MRSHRLSRLALLTKGVALVGFGLSELACGGDPPPATPINAPPPAAPREVNPDEGARDASAPPAASTPPSADVGPAKPDHVNSPSPTGRVPPPGPSVPKRVNSPGPQAPPKP